MTNYLFWINTTPIIDTLHNSKCSEFRRYDRDVVKYNFLAKTIMKICVIPVVDLYSYTKQFG